MAKEFGLKNILLRGELWLDEEQIEFDSDHKISDVENSVSGGSKWLSVTNHGTSWRGTLTAGLMRSITGTATFYTTSKLKNKNTIEILQKSIEETKYQIAFQEDSLNEIGGLSGDGTDSESV